MEIIPRWVFPPAQYHFRSTAVDPGFRCGFFGWGRRLEQQESGGVEGAGEECRKRRSDRWVHPHPAHPWISLQVVYDFGAFLVICSSSISWLRIWQSRIRIEVSNSTYLSLPVAEIPVPFFVSDFCCGFWLQGDINISPRALPVLLCNLVGESTGSGEGSFFCAMCSSRPLPPCSYVVFAQISSTWRFCCGLCQRKKLHTGESNWHHPIFFGSLDIGVLLVTRFMPVRCYGQKKIITAAQRLFTKIAMLCNIVNQAWTNNTNA